MQIRAVALSEASALTGAMVAELSVRYDSDAAGSPIDDDEFRPPYGLFLVASVDGADVGCGGLRLLRDGIGEVKRMYADPAYRGRGIARALLRGLLEHARSAGLQEVWLETGTMQPEAIALYESEGFTPIEAYGHYKDEPLSRCYQLAL